MSNPGIKPKSAEQPSLMETQCHQGSLKNIFFKLYKIIEYVKCNKYSPEFKHEFPIKTKYNETVGSIEK